MLSRNMLRSIRLWFDALPTPVKIIIYNGFAFTLALLITDIESMNTRWSEYLVVPLGMCLNIIAWSILRLNGEKD
jgi:hypothetical protein